VHNLKKMSLIESTSKIMCKSHIGDTELMKMKQTTLQKKPTSVPLPPGLEPCIAPEMCAGIKKMSDNTAPSAAILLELVTIVTQIANLDKMLDSVRGSAPTESSEAAQWHKVSMQALEMSRQTLHEKQMTLLQSLTSVTDTAQPAEIPNQTADLFSGGKAMDAIPKETQSDCSTMISDEGRPESVMSSTFESEGEYGTRSLGEAEGKSEADINQSMRLQLEKLKQHPAGHALIVRKIKSLGFDSAEVLKEHFGQYGSVAEVLVAHSITKPSAKRSKGRVRPATLGFVVMASLEGAAAALAAGEQQMITTTAPCTIEVSRHQANLSLEAEEVA